MLSVIENIHKCSQSGRDKISLSFDRIFLLSILAGVYIAFAAAVSSTAAFGIQDAGLARLVTGLIFPFGLGMVMLCGAEIFTGNCLIVISVLERTVKLRSMLCNWSKVYIFNLIGAMLIAAACVFLGQLNYGDGALAVYTIQIAVAKCSLPFASAVVFGILCNILVCTGIISALASTDNVGRIVCTYIPVAFFVICGFEHSIANMFYIPAGLFAIMKPEYAALALNAGIDVSGLTWGAFFLQNLLPVTLGNMIGGVGFGILMWRSYRRFAT